jgi:hypothetical protein
LKPGLQLVALPAAKRPRDACDECADQHRKEQEERALCCRLSGLISDFAQQGLPRMSTGTKVAIVGAAALFGCYELGCFSHRSVGAPNSILSEKARSP